MCTIIVGAWRLVLCFLVISQIVSACTCASPPPGTPPSTVRRTAEEEFVRTDLVFEGVAERVEVAPEPLPGHLLDIRTPWGSHVIATFRAVRIYSGPKDGVFLIRTPLSESACGFDFEAGQRYLVYAEKGSGDFYTTSICSSTAPIERAAVNLRSLRGEPPVPEDSLEPHAYHKKMASEWTGTLCGRVTLPNRKPASSADVLLIKGRKEWIRNIPHVETAKPDGSFCFEMIDPGQYLLAARFTSEKDGQEYSGYYPNSLHPGDATPVEVRAGVSSSDYQLSLQKRRRFVVRGRVDVSGQRDLPMDKIQVLLVPKGGDFLSLPSDDSNDDFQVRADGTFEISGVSPGHYELVGWVVEENRGATDEVQSPTPLEWSFAKMDVEIHGDTNDLLVTISPVR